MGGGGLMESGSSRWSRVGDGVTSMSWPTCQAAANTYPNPADHPVSPINAWQPATPWGWIVVLAFDSNWLCHSGYRGGYWYWVVVSCGGPRMTLAVVSS